MRSNRFTSFTVVFFFIFERFFFSVHGASLPCRLDFHNLPWALPSFTGFHAAFAGYRVSYCGVVAVESSFTEFLSILPGFYGDPWALPSFTEFHALGTR